MKLLKAEGGRYSFRLGRREKGFLIEVLRHFPLIPRSHHRASRQDAEGRHREVQELLEETMATQKESQRQRVRRWIDNAQQFVADGAAYRVALTREDLEWLLQVLNDVRVGSWLIVGSPDPEEGRAPKLTRDNARYLFLMELAGHFECAILEALDGTGP